MDVIARRAFERRMSKPTGPGHTPRQHGSRFARGAKWSQDDHDAIAFGSGANSPVDTEGAVMDQHGTFAIPKAGQFCSLSKK